MHEMVIRMKEDECLNEDHLNPIMSNEFVSSGINKTNLVLTLRYS